MNLLVLNCENIFTEIKFLICILETPFVKFAIFETQFAQVSPLEWEGLVRSKTSETLPDIPIFGTLFLYHTLQ